jgi:DNA-binding response OmpR family regulator
MNYLQRHQKAVPIMAAGATGMESALDNGAELFLTKPLAVDELTMGLKKIVYLMNSTI